jgi:radical SAM protein with 4Fe4S-binding SPASM domain
MIGFTKLLCGTATVSDAIRHAETCTGVPPHMLQFTTDSRPLVVWNVTNRCNLRCVHCYAGATGSASEGELSTDEGKRLIDDLADTGCPVILFSGGEPYLREDIFELGSYAANRGLRPVVSTNGTLISRKIAIKTGDAGFQYVGISLDGLAEHHNRFRGSDRAFQDALDGLRNCLAVGLKAGVRFTVTKHNLADLDGVLDLVEREHVPRFCLYHLVYSGRGREMVDMDLTKDERRAMVERLMERALDWDARGVDVELLTTDNHADGVMIEQYVREHQPPRAAEVHELLVRHGGCSAGRKFACVDAHGEVHPCQFWRHVPLGNVRERSFGEIWNDTENELLRKLKHIADNLTGERCGRCDYRTICGGCRIRAEAVYGDIWADDPQCYLRDDEILGRDAELNTESKQCVTRSTDRDG